MTVTVSIRNTAPVSATGGPFDVDVYPHLEEAPALMTLGADKQWETLGPGETKVLTFFVEVAQIGTNSLWAQVDTSNYIAESDETNNVFGPITFDVCTGSDDFDAGLGTFWTRRNVGSNVNGSYAVNATGQLTMRSTGTRLFEINQDSSFYYIYQKLHRRRFRRAAALDPAAKTKPVFQDRLVSAGRNGVARSVRHEYAHQLL
jgi:hypothetical protein